MNKTLDINDVMIQRSMVATPMISDVHVSPGSAETLVRRGGITNQRLIVYSLSNMSANNY